MTMHTSDLQALVKRLDIVERHNRWMRRAGAAALLLLGAFALMGSQDTGKRKSEEPKKIVLRDDKGNERVYLGMDKAGPTLRFRDENGNERVWLGVANDTPGLVLYDANGKRRAALSASPRAVSLMTYDDNEKRQALLVLGKEATALHHFGPNGRQHAGLSVEDDGVALWHHDKVGKVHAGETAVKNVPGLLLPEAAINPLFSKP